MKKAILVMGLVLMMGTGVVLGTAIHTATFNTDLEGWNGYAPGGYFTRMANNGVGNSGFLYAYRPSWYPGLSPDTAPATTYFQNNLRGLYGPLIRISAYVEFINGTDKGCALEFQSTADLGYTQWQKTIFAVGQTPWTWTRYVQSINMDWTDTDAQANGWVRIYGSASWTSTVGNIYQTKFFTQVNGSGSASGNQIIGMDEVTFSDNVTETVQGTVILGNYTGDSDPTPVPIAVRVELRQNGNTVQTAQKILDANGRFTLDNVIPGVYDIVIKSYANLEKVLSAVNVGNNPTILDAVTLMAGNVDGNNVVDSTDLESLLANMDLPGD